jgi:hypothetical protein
MWDPAELSLAAQCLRWVSVKGLQYGLKGLLLYEGGERGTIVPRGLQIIVDTIVPDGWQTIVAALVELTGNFLPSTLCWDVK